VAASLLVAVLTLAVALAAEVTEGLGVLVTLVNVGRAGGVRRAARRRVRPCGGARREPTRRASRRAAAGVLVIGVVVSAADVARGLGAIWRGAGVVAVSVWARRERRRVRTAPVGGR
jgi:hypothetical protein